MLVNGAILVLAGSAFHAVGQPVVDDIEQAYQLITPLAGGAAALLFGLALLASGQSSTLTGTVAGQVIMDGFLHIRIPCYQRRLITRGLALLPALLGVLLLGEGAVGRMLVWSQVVLSLQLPLAMWPLLRLTSSRQHMGRLPCPPDANGGLVVVHTDLRGKPAADHWPVSNKKAAIRRLFY
jgi:manganese transport protein